MNSLALVYMKEKGFDAARELLNSVVEIQPNNNEAYKYLGYCYLMLKQYDQAIKSYSKGVEINELDWESHRGLGVAYILNGKNEKGEVDEASRKKALYHWRRSLEVNPDQPNREGLEKYIKYYS